MGSNLQGSFNGAIRAPLIEQGEEGSSSPTSDSEVNSQGLEPRLDFGVGLLVKSWLKGIGPWGLGFLGCRFRAYRVFITDKTGILL